MRDDQTPGLIFRVTDAGKRTWSLRFRNAANQQRRLLLGEFPAVGLAEARRRANVAKGEISGGSDPVQKARDEGKAAEVKRLNTFAVLGGAYFSDAAIGLHKASGGLKRASTIAEERRAFDKYVSPHFGKTPIGDINRAEVQTFVNGQSKIAPSRGRLCRNVVRQILAYGEWKQLIPYNPALKVAAPKPQARKTVIGDDDLKAIWWACKRPQDVPHLDLSPEMGLALRMAIVVLQRGSEVVGMRRSELNRAARTWLIPAERMKGKREHLVPLSDLAIELLDEVDAVIGSDSDFVFASPRTAEGQEAKQMDRSSFTRAMSRVVSALKIGKATPHDFRRTGATNITSERIGMSRFIVSQVIGHAGDTGGAAAVTGQHYDLNDYLPEKRKALDAWATVLMQIVSKRAEH